MWQRFQTFYSVLGIIALIVSAFIASAVFYVDENEVIVSLSGYTRGNDFIKTGLFFHRVSHIFIGLIACLFAFAIASYKKMKQQIRVLYLNFLLLLVYVVFLFTSTQSIVADLGVDMQDVSYHLGTYLPVVSVAFCILAIRGVRKDMELLRSVDRIR